MTSPPKSAAAAETTANEGQERAEAETAETEPETEPEAEPGRVPATATASALTTARPQP
ncbi:hypothetical protein [Streptomyces albus]|uniref:hypothetical protein n=1 Tax=Streptomyces albus TaxID=1888 RepID=UPI003455D43E